MPDLVLTFTNPNVISDCAFHPCVRYVHTFLVDPSNPTYLHNQPTTLETRQDSFLHPTGRKVRASRIPVFITAKHGGEQSPRASHSQTEHSRWRIGWCVSSRLLHPAEHSSSARQFHGHIYLANDESDGKREDRVVPRRGCEQRTVYVVRRWFRNWIYWRSRRLVDI